MFRQSVSTHYDFQTINEAKGPAKRPNAGQGRNSQSQLGFGQRRGDLQGNVQTGLGSNGRVIGKRYLPLLYGCFVQESHVQGFFLVPSLLDSLRRLYLLVPTPIRSNVFNNKWLEINLATTEDKSPFNLNNNSSPGLVSRIGTVDSNGAGNQIGTAASNGTVASNGADNRTGLEFNLFNLNRLCKLWAKHLNSSQIQQTSLLALIPPLAETIGETARDWELVVEIWYVILLRLNCVSLQGSIGGGAGGAGQLYSIVLLPVF